MPADAEALGTHLEISRADINGLKDDNIGKLLFHKVIDTWLDLAKPTELKELLADALDKSGYSRISRKLRGE